MKKVEGLEMIDESPHRFIEGDRVFVKIGGQYRPAEVVRFVQERSGGPLLLLLKVFFTKGPTLLQVHPRKVSKREKEEQLETS